MNALNKISSINKITIILNNLSSNFDKIQKLVESNKRMELIENQYNLANFYYRADLSIGASGFSSWERCYLGLPAIVITTADNQKNLSRRSWSKQNLLFCVQIIKM